MASDMGYEINLKKEPFNGEPSENLEAVTRMYKDGTLGEAFEPLLKAVKDEFSFYREFVQVRMDRERELLRRGDPGRIAELDESMARMRRHLHELHREVSSSILVLSGWITDLDEAAEETDGCATGEVRAAVNACVTTINTIVYTYSVGLDIEDESEVPDSNYGLPRGYPLTPRICAS